MTNSQPVMVRMFPPLLEALDKEVERLQSICPVHGKVTRSAVLRVALAVFARAAAVPPWSEGGHPASMRYNAERWTDDWVDTMLQPPFAEKS